MSERVVIQGGGLAGLAAALEYAGGGKETVIVEPRTYLGRELTAAGQAYLRNGSSENEIPFPLGLQKKLYLQYALDAGISVLFLERIVGTAWDGAGKPGVLLAGKFGVRFIYAGSVLYEQQPVASRLVEYVFDVERLRPMLERSITLPSDLNVCGNRVNLHYSMRNRTASVSFRMETDGCSCIRERTRIETRARRKAAEIFLCLKRTCKSFADAVLLDFAGEVSFLSGDEKLRVGKRSFSLPLRTSDVKKIFDDTDGVVPALLESGKYNSAAVLNGGAVVPCNISTLANGNVNAVEFYQADLDFSQAELLQWNCDVAVAGMGACGTFAALALKEEKADYIGVEQFYDFGGTRTLGMVSGNYHGYRHGIERAVGDKVSSASAALSGGKGDSSDRTARMYLYQDELKDSAIIGGSIICGAEAEGKKLKAVVICNDYGVQRIKANLTIDCTSDADVAVMCGVPYEMGCPVDGTVQSYGQWGIETWDNSVEGVPNFQLNRFRKDPDMVRQSQYDDLLRCIYLSHTDNSDYNFSPILTPRESRRIAGEYRLTFADIISGKYFADVISVGLTPYDTHGRASSDLLKIGLLRFNEEEIAARVPLSAAIPKNFNGLLVGGKSTSSSRDANSIYRMNADIENLGYALGIAASEAVGKEDIRDADIVKIQGKLRQIGVLPDWAFSNKNDNPAERINKLILSSYKITDVISLPKESVYPMLIDSFKQHPNNLGLSLALAWFLDGRGAGIIYEELTSELNSDVDDGKQLVSETGYGMRPITFTGPLGAYHKINMYIVLLGFCGYETIYETIKTLCGRITETSAVPTGEHPYHKNRLDTHVLPFGQRIIAICEAVSRLADRKYLNHIERLLELPQLKGYVKLPLNSDDGNLFMCAWTEIQLAMCASRCGSINGWLRLAEYTGDTRPILADIALNHLRLLSNQDFGGNPKDWETWIKNQHSVQVVRKTGDAYFG